MQMMLLLFALLLQSAFAIGPLETKVQQFEELQQLLQRYCINNPNKANVRVLVNRTELSCNQLLAIAQRLQAQIDDQVDDLQESCDQNPQPDASRLARQSSQIAQQSVCRQQSTDMQCLEGFACSMAFQIGQSIPIFGAPISQMVRGCRGNYQAGGCIQSIAKGIFDSLWGTISAVWDLGKAAVRGVGEWLGIIEAGENSTTERLMAMQRATRAYVGRFIRNPIQTLRESAQAIFNGLRDAAMSSYGCEQWSDPMRPFLSRCLRPMTNWNCASCQQKLQVFCGIAGMAIGEIPTALLTGGVMGIAGRIAGKVGEALRIQARLGRVNRGVAELLGRFRPPAGLAARTEAIAARTARVLSAAERRVMATWARIKGSPLSQALNRAYRSVPAQVTRQVAGYALRPAAFYADAIEAAARVGFRAGDNIAGAVIGNSERALVSSAATTERIAGSMTQVERELPQEALAVSDVTADDLRNLAGDTVTVPEEFLPPETPVTTGGTTVPAPVTTTPERSGITVSSPERVPERVPTPTPTPTPVPEVPSVRTTTGATTPETPAVPSTEGVTLSTRAENIERATNVASRHGLTLDEMVSEITGIPDTPAGLSLRRRMIKDDFPNLSDAQIEALVNDVHMIGADTIRAGRSYSPAELLAKQRRMRELGISDGDADALLRTGYTGSNPSLSPDDAFSEARSAALRGRELRGRLRDGGNITLDDVKSTFRDSAQGYEREGVRTNSPQFIGEAWRLYSRAGEGSNAVRMMETGVQRFGMNPQRVVEGVDDYLVRDLLPRIRQSNPPNPALVLERDTLFAARNEAAGRFNLPRITREDLTGERRISTSTGTTTPTTSSTPTSNVPPTRTQTQVSPQRPQGNGGITVGNSERTPVPPQSTTVTPQPAVTTGTTTPRTTTTTTPTPRPRPQRDLAGRITDDLHTTWRENFIRENGPDAIRNKAVPQSVIRAGETPEQALARLEADGVTGLSVVDGKLVQNINQPAEAIIPELNATLNGNLAGEYAQLVQRGTFRSPADFERGSSEVHEIWMRNNEWQREANPELFRPYNELTAEEKIKDLDVLEQSLRARDPAFANNSGLREYRQRLQREVAAEREMRRPVTDFTPQQARSLANDYRLGNPSRNIPRNPERAAQLYYRGADDIIARESSRTRGFQSYNQTNFMDTRGPMYDAFMNSLDGNGSTAIQIIRDIRAAGGEERGAAAMNAFIRENYERFNTRMPSPTQRANMRKIFQALEPYKNEIDWNYWRSWQSAQYD